MAAARDAELLLGGCSELGICLTAEQQRKLLSLLDSIYVWNRSAGLTAIAREDAVRLHLLDCLAAAGSLGQGRCLDLGSGAGLPGLVLAVARPDLAFTLLESNRRRGSFLHEMVRDLGLANARVESRSIESFPVEAVYETVISRAFRPPAEFLALAAPFAAPGGRIVLMLAQASDEELARLAAPQGLGLVDVRRITLPVGGEPRTIARYARS